MGGGGGLGHYTVISNPSPQSQSPIPVPNPSPQSQSPILVPNPSPQSQSLIPVPNPRPQSQVPVPVFVDPCVCLCVCPAQVCQEHPICLAQIFKLFMDDSLISLYLSLKISLSFSAISVLSLSLSFLALIFKLFSQHYFNFISISVLY